MTTTGQGLSDGIAVVGISGRYPGARTLEQFWEILRDGRETITHFTSEQYIEAGFDPDMVHDPTFVKARPVYEGPMGFDAPFFGYTPREAEIIDPQQRVFLECAWEALEDAGYDPLVFPGPIGLFGGSGMTYYLFSLIDNQRVMSTMGGLAVTTSNEKDYFATRAGYKLNLRGPCVTVQTACSTALVGIIFACQSLLTYQTDMALAGGATIAPSEIGGYFFTEGGIVSPDGHNRTFDAAGRGTVFGSGAGVVVLKRLKDAIADRDTIHAVIRGFGINNDGSAKLGFTAPAVDGQAAVCLDALAVAGVNPETISYLECHGTATPLGDLVEITALTKAFRAYTDKKRYCAVGSVKTNIGHMDAAAGVAGFTKAVLALKHKLIPPSLHFETPNPQIDFENSPFYVNTTLAELKRHNGTPLRAGISSFGVGGTNAHIVLEEAPEIEASSNSRPWQLLTWSAKTQAALDKITANLADHIERHPADSLADVAFTLQTGRRILSHRRVLVCRDREDAIAALTGAAPARILSLTKDADAQSVAFLFPGQGSQHPGMAREIYENEPLFREQVDLCSQILEPHLGLDLRQLIYPPAGAAAEAEETLKQTRYAQPALFTIEYALARLWMEWGIQPEAMIGHSIGEYVAACLADVFTLPDALKLVAERGALMQRMPAGSMLGVLLSETEAQPRLAPFANLSVAAVNAPSTCVISGPTDQIEALEQSLAAADVPARRLHTSHAFHSAMMEPILEEFGKVVRQARLAPPKLRYLSNLTGKWIAASEATDPEYWVKHLRQAVRFSENVAALLDGETRMTLLEVGPGRTLGSLVSQHPARRNEHAVLASLPAPKSDASTELQFLLTTAGRLWLEGKPLRWSSFYAAEKRRRISLPTYPFDHENYVVDLTPRAQDPSQVSHRKIQDISKWFHYSSWKRVAPLPAGKIPEQGCAIVFMDSCGVGARIAAKLREASLDVITVNEGTEFSANGPFDYTIRPAEQEDYAALLDSIAEAGMAPSTVAHLWGVTADTAVPDSELAIYQSVLDRGFMSLFHLAPGLNARFASGAIRLCVVTSDMHDVTGNGVPLPTKAAVIGPCRATMSECPNVDIRIVDIGAPESATRTDQVSGQLLSELFAERSDDVIAYRGGHRWLQSFEPMPVAPVPDREFGLRKDGVYLITGGLGGIGIVIAEAIASRVPAKLALFSRSTLPPRESWEQLRHGTDLVAEKIRRVLRMEELGSQVMVFGADVSDLEQMREALAHVEEQFGPVTGLVHSAGVAGGGIMLLKSKEAMDVVLQPKIRGTLVLEELLKDRTLDFFLLCSSLNAFLGEGGISDYIGANAFLDAFAHSRANAKTPPVSIQWDSWEDVGMVAHGWFDAPKGPQANPVVERLDHPMFSARIAVNGGHTYVLNLNVENHWVVAEHVLMGSPTLVGTTHLQLAHTAFTLSEGEGPVEMRDVLFLAPLVMQGESDREVHVALEPLSDGYWGFQVKSRKGSEWQSHAMGRVGRSHDDRRIVHDVGAVMGRCEPLVRRVDTTFAPDLKRVPFLQFGGRWRNLESQTFGANEALGVFTLAEQFADDFDVWGMHPAMLDRATGFAVHRAGAEGAHYLPFAYNRVRVSGKLTSKFYSHVRYEPGDEYVSSSVVIMDEQGNQLVQIDGYEVKRVPEDLLATSDPQLVAAGANRPSAAPVEAAKPKRAARILSEEGGDVFHRILTLQSFRQVAVACRDLRAVQAEIRGVLGSRSTQGKSEDQGTQTYHPRPELATPYAEPRNDLERALAEIWQGMLGIANIGINDDFLELGGNSLLGIQIASRIRADFEIELSAATFYKSPTIALLAESIVETLQAGLDENALAEALNELESEGAAETVTQGAAA